MPHAEKIDRSLTESGQRLRFAARLGGRFRYVVRDLTLRYPLALLRQRRSLALLDPSLILDVMGRLAGIVFMRFRR